MPAIIRDRVAVSTMSVIGRDVLVSDLCEAKISREIAAEGKWMCKTDMTDGPYTQH